ncbi:SDR family NAD(P)-dependent oxidoreductase [Bacteroidota bacterium]
MDIYTIAFDVTDEKAVVGEIKTVQPDVGHIDILVNNAGMKKTAVEKSSIFVL